MVRVAVIGSINMDLVVRAGRFPQAGETLLGRGFQMIPGGKGANQAVAGGVPRGGTQSGGVGGDAFGEALRRNLAADGINTERVVVDETQPTGVALITVDDRGENTIIAVPGANGTIARSDIEAARGLISGANLLIMQLEVPLEVIHHAAHLAREHRVPVILNAAPAQVLAPRSWR